MARKKNEVRVLGCIQSLNGDLREVIVLRREDIFGHIVPNSYIVQYGNVVCTAFHNTLVNKLYVDDVYGVLPTGTR